MAATHANDMVFSEGDDDDGMPPLVDNPIPSMTFTFATDMTPITYSTDPNSYEMPPQHVGTEMSMYSPPASPIPGAIRGSHAKKRDASYIPRPPNAFILFRSSFIRAQHIPGKIEGNHSALSKIIGKCWKALPREEREVWEAKAIVAQAEHRMMYPDWRFRPGANALAKVKDGPKRRSNKKGRGEAEKEVRSREKRCAKIADLLVAGKTGMDLEAAVQEYDCSTGSDTRVKEERCADVVMKPQNEVRSDVERAAPTKEKTIVEDASFLQSTGGPALRSKTPDAKFDARFKVPLTSMFKRASSAPASYTRNDGGSSGRAPLIFAGRRDSFSTVSPSVIDSPVAGPHVPPSIEHEEEARVADDIKTSDDSADTSNMGCVFTTQSLTDFAGNAHSRQSGVAAMQWGNSHDLSSIDTSCTSPTLPAFDPDTDGLLSSTQSPASIPFDPSPGCDGHGNMTAFEHPGFGENACSPMQSSYSSLKGWAGDAFVKPPSNAPLPFIGPPFVYGSDTVSVMQNAFEAATSAICGDWTGGYGGVGYLTNRWNSPPDWGSLQHYSEGLQTIHCRQDNNQLFDRIGFPVQKRCRFAQF
ncbi:hypothetical protein B0H21DRAFT_53085 [Amylocystis lapponica]|nr:hypothetical protein B0H21DRAFT_53085 [Amylocystis lapponica]